MQFTQIPLLSFSYPKSGLPLITRPPTMFAARSRALRCHASTIRLSTLCTWSSSSLTFRSFPPHKSINSLSSYYFKNKNISTSRTHAAAKTPSSPSNDDEEEDEEILEDGDVLDDDEFEDEEEYFGMEITTGGTEWGETILSAVQRLLSTDDTMEIYSFRVSGRSKRVDIRLDKLTNKYGSPSLDEVGQFSRDLNQELETIMGEEKAGEIEIEVSSPGAERFVKVPDEFDRFGEMPMLVEYDDGGTGVEGGKERKKTVLQFRDVSGDGGEMVSNWTLADVRANRSGKGRLLNKKQRETVIEIPVEAIIQVNLHVDI
jgi:ribosome maturation factor RimP